MTNYYLESGADEADDAVIHELDCSSYDLGSLLGAGRLLNLGEFASSASALEAVKARHPAVVRCRECCCDPETTEALPLYVWRGMTRDFVVVEAL